jgi:hypothetical protein
LEQQLKRKQKRRREQQRRLRVRGAAKETKRGSKVEWISKRENLYNGGESGVKKNAKTSSQGIFSRQRRKK